MLKQTISTILLAAMLTTGLTACGTGETTTDTASANPSDATQTTADSAAEAAETEPETEPAPLTKADYPDFVLPEATDTLTVYSTEMLGFTLNPALDIFRELYPEVEVISKTMTEEEYETIIRTEIPAGRGPDLLFSHGTDLPDVYKTMSSGVFLDLNPYFLYDEEFNPDDYFTGMLDSGLYGRERFLVPVSCCLPLLTTSAEVLTEEEIAPDSFSTIEGLLTACETYKANYHDRTVFADNGYITGFNLLKILYEKCGIQLIDYRNNTVTMDYDSLKAIADIAKLHYTAGEQNKTGRITYMDIPKHQALFNGDHTSMWSLFMIEHYNVVCTNEENHLVYTFPDINGGSTAQIMTFAAVSSNTENTLNAWRLIKILLSEEIQCGTSETLGNLTIASPVLKEGLRKYISMQAEQAFYGTYELSEETMDEFCALAEQIDHAVLAPPILVRYFQMEMMPYVQGDRSFDNCFDNLKNTIELYKDE